MHRTITYTITLINQCILVSSSADNALDLSFAAVNLFQENYLAIQENLSVFLFFGNSVKANIFKGSRSTWSPHLNDIA